MLADGQAAEAARMADLATPARGLSSRHRFMLLDIIELRKNRWLLTGALATAMVLMNYSKSMVDGFTFLTQVVTAANLPLYLLCAVALIVVTRRGHARPPASLFVLGLLGSTYVIFAFIGLGREPFVWSLVLGAAGLPLYWLMRKRRASVPA
jgi:APA family basic amino acid/polyamine antiporter